MTDHLDSLPDPSGDELAMLADVLARDDVWADPPRSLEDDVVAAILTESDAASPTAADPAVASLAEHRARRTWSPGRLLGAAAVAALVVAGVAVLTSDGNDARTFALAGTEAAPGASAQVEVAATPAGLKLVLDVEDLEGAPAGFMYEAWVGDGEIAVSAGTFHLRGGDDPIELWAGVADPSFRRFWITLEPVDTDLSPSGDTRLRGEIEISD